MRDGPGGKRRSHSYENQRSCWRRGRQPQAEPACSVPTAPGVGALHTQASHHTHPEEAQAGPWGFWRAPDLSLGGRLEV